MNDSRVKKLIERGWLKMSSLFSFRKDVKKEKLSAALFCIWLFCQNLHLAHTICFPCPNCRLTNPKSRVSNLSISKISFVN